MIQIDEPSLQSVLRNKYNIHETLFAEGRFVSLIGDHAANLVCLGLSMKCLVIAKIVFSGNTMDYDLLSLIPLTLLSMSYQWSSQKVTVRSRFKPSQIFQLCSSTHQAEVWDNFTSMIRDVYQHDRGDVWIPATLKSVHDVVPTVYVQSEFKHQSINSPSGDILHQYQKFTEISASLQFDSFVNDTQPLMKEEQDFNMSNNNNIVAPSGVSVTMDTSLRSESKVANFFRRCVSCFSSK